MADLHGKVCVVTGASRGVGKGIAIALGEMGATVYVTGRSRPGSVSSALGGTVDDTVTEITRRGGKGIAVACDHGNDAEVAELFSRVGKEQGRIDILVSNALAVPDGLTDPGPFWEKSLDLLGILRVGMRSHYVAAWHAAPLLVKAKGLLVFTSSFGGTCYMHGPAYGAGKAATDKMAHDMAVDFKPFGVAAVSLWLGLMKTERTLSVCAAEPEKYGAMLDAAESPEFPGRVIAALYADPERERYSGQVQVGAELALHYGITDVDGRQPPSHRPFLGDPPAFSAAVIE
ncbi:MAG: SDR family NAD(P)-dependent oxidoreductase [Proteobacteria bacterium]|nr:SDR family NAD(P)-dependent oxidoreductase [Pseudomonadota bacterium]HQR04392.1 SDR family NAD(P)-dependent oxidoreductase [Rhodocyclaceae bacterium]